VAIQQSAALQPSPATNSAEMSRRRTPSPSEPADVTSMAEPVHLAVEQKEAP